MPNTKSGAGRTDGDGRAAHAGRDTQRRERRPRALPKEFDSPDPLGGDDGHPCEPSALHALRLDTVLQALHAAGVRSVADLGCGDGALVRRLLADPRFDKVVALDRDLGRLGRLERSVPPDVLRSGRLHLVHGSFAAHLQSLAGIDAVAMVETIEHLAPAELSALEHQVFSVVQPAVVAITTPNVEYNGLLGMAPGQLREPGHRFEWPRSRFRAWASGVASRRGYAVQMAGIGPEDPAAGCPTQWALFECAAGPDPSQP